MRMLSARQGGVGCGRTAVAASRCAAAAQVGPRRNGSAVQVPELPVRGLPHDLVAYMSLPRAS